jgi:hypothetical protein
MTAASAIASVAEQDLLDLARVDVVAAADDQVLLAVDDEQVAVVVAVGEVAGVEPAALERLRGLLGLVVVALHDVVAADDDLADVLLPGGSGCRRRRRPDLHAPAPACRSTAPCAARR